ncbi:type II toxin-antitoxin system Phd/YefM family antitoxin [Staphylococcus felis]|uniref:type II toxin-antitoxin system Phd/YefM family antitoxin n=1 Tax=Staphylococcus felis TaxID=46127 RepID=UPI000E22E0CF|nr:type II toxin-antitoxin system Phd/YefM family antitoxin [Staphylococcus felis]REI08297.1 prevent-host-death protein [Staphylococcus felis]
MYVTHTYSNIPKVFRSLIDRVNNDSDVVTITMNDCNAVLTSEADYNAFMETLYLLQSLVNVRHLA